MKLPAEGGYVYSSHTKVAHCVVAVNVEGFRGPADSTTPCVRLGVVINPIITQRVRELGGRADDTTLTIPTKQLANLLAVLEGGAVPVSYRRHTATSAISRTGAARLGRFCVDGNSRTTTLRLEAKRDDVPLFGEAKKVTVTQAIGICIQMKQQKFALMERGTPGSLARAAEMVADVTTVDRAPGTLGLFTTASGGEPTDAETILEAIDSGESMVFSANAAESLVLTATIGTGLAGLRRSQDLFVARYQEVNNGMVLALATGQGKTVAASAALAVRATRHPVLALIAAPKAVVDQWKYELATWFPDATVVGASDNLPKSPAVIVDSYDRIAGRVETFVDVPFTDYFVDEANVLTGSSKRARALRRLRKSSQRAVAITGTVQQSGLVGVEALLQWALGEPVALSVSPFPLTTVVGPYLLQSEADGDIEVITELRPCPPLGAAFDDLGGWVTEPWRRLQELGGTEVELLAGHRKQAGRLRFDIAQRLKVWCNAEAASNDHDKQSLVGDLCKERRSVGSKTVVFCDRISSADTLVSTLRNSGMSVELYDSRRLAVLGECDVIVVTKKGQRGVNLQHANTVIHYDLPLLPGQRTQRVGRVARIGGSAQVHEYFVAHEGVPLYLAGLQDRDTVGWVGEIAHYLDSASK